MGFRLDIRENVADIGIKLIAAAETLDCYLFVPAQKVIFKPNMSALLQYIRQFTAAKFVNNPMKYSDEITEKHNK